MSGGMDSSAAQFYRNQSDSLFMRGLIESYVFMDIAKVTGYIQGKVACEVGSQSYTDVEVLILGVNGFGLKFVPAIGDRVLLFAPRTPMASVEKFDPSYTMPNYDRSGLKCIPLTDNKSNQLFTVDKDKIELSFATTSTNKNILKINKDGFSFEDTNHNKVSTTSSGITVTDAKSNTVTMTDKSIKAQVNSGCSINITDSSIVLQGKNGKVEVK